MGPKQGSTSIFGYFRSSLQSSHRVSNPCQRVKVRPGGVRESDSDLLLSADPVGAGVWAQLVDLVRVQTHT